MGGQDNGLTLLGLAERLEALEHENADLRHKVGALEGSATDRSEIASLRGSDTHRDQEEPTSETGGLVSRRALLSKAGAAAAGLLAAGALTQRDIRHAQATPAVFQTTTPDRAAVEGVNSSSSGIGVRGYSRIGVEGEGTNAGVIGRSGPIYGDGVVGYANGPEYAGVVGTNSDGTGVWGKSSKTGYAGVTAQHTGSLGFGIVGDGTGAAGAGVLGRNSSGYGGQFEGGRAQLKLKPGGSAGKPSGGHTKGEIYMDSAGALFVCTAGSTATVAAKWRKVTMTAV